MENSHDPTGVISLSKLSHIHLKDHLLQEATQKRRLQLIPCQERKGPVALKTETHTALELWHGWHMRH